MACGTSQIEVNPKPGPRGDGSPCTVPTVSKAEAVNFLIQRDPGGLAQGFVDLDLGCSTILLGQ